MALPGIHLPFRFGDETSTPSGLDPDLDHPLYRMLEALSEAGSVQHAATVLGMSYRHLWGRLRDWEERLDEPLVLWVRGQSARLTPLAQQRLAAYRMARARLAPHLDAVRQELAGALAVGGPPAFADLSLDTEHEPLMMRLRERAFEMSALSLRLRLASSGAAWDATVAGRCQLAALALPPRRDGDLAGVEGSTAGKPGRLWRIPCFRRMQGLLVAPGNPLAVSSLADAVRRGLRFIDAEPGNGRRQLAERHLREAGLDSCKLNRVGTEPTASAAAMAVALGYGDLTFGPSSQAEGLALDFLPLVEEEWVVICHSDTVDTPALQALMRVLRSAAWCEDVIATNGCSPSPEAGTPVELLQPGESL